MSLLEHIPDVINKDPELAMAIFECECSLMAIMAHNISKKQQEEEEEKKKKNVVFGWDLISLAAHLKDIITTWCES